MPDEVGHLNLLTPTQAKGSWRSANNWDILEVMFISSHQHLSFDFVLWIIHRFSQNIIKYNILTE